MHVLKFVSSLLPQFGRSRLEEDLRIIRTEIETAGIPAYSGALVVFSKDPQSKEILALQSNYNQALGSDRSKNKTMIADISAKLETLKPTIELLEKVIEKDFEIEIVTAGITLPKATALRMLELLGFVSTFSLRLLNYCYVLESAAVASDSAYANKQLSSGEVKLIEQHVFDFALALQALSRPVQKLEKELKDIPEVLVNSKGSSALQALGHAKADRLNVFAVQGFTNNPIYHIGLIVAEWQSDNYKRTKDLKATLELRLLRLQRQADGQEDPGLEREIEVLQSRIDKYAEKLRKTEAGVQ